MKLHLPTGLRAALLSVFAATTAHAITTSTTTYADGTVFNGDIWTWNNYSDGTNVSAANSKFTNYSTGQQYAGDASLATIGGPDKFWKVVQFNSETEYVGNTLRFAGNPGNIRLNTDYNAWVWIGGIITEAGNSGTFTLGRDSSDFRLKGNHDVNLMIGSNFTLKSGSDRSTEIMTGGTWDVASGKTLTFTGKSLTFYAGQAVDITGGGTVVFDTPFTGQVGSRFSVGGDATLTFNQAATIGGTISNSGNVNFRGAVTLSDSLSGFTATGSYVDYNGDTAANGYAGALEYTIVSGTGNVEGLSSVTWNGTTKQVVDGKVTIGGAVDYSTYHLLTPGAELDLAAELQRNSLLTTVSLSAGTTLHVNTDFGGTVEALGAASVDIASAKVFSGTLSGGVLQGAGTYALAANQSTLGSVSLGQGWTGTVRLSGSIADLKLDAAQLGNKVELMGVSGHFFALQADETTTYSGTLVLNNAGDSTPALLVNNGYSRDNAYYRLAGAVEGGGTWRFEKGGSAVTNRIVFSGDVSAWSGALEVARGFNVDLTFAHRNGTVNAALSRSQGTLNVHVDEDTTFNAALSGVSELTVAAGKTAALNADSSVSTVNLSGTLDLGGRSVEIATLTSANDAALLKNGTVTGDLAISGGNLTADGVRFTPETSLSVEDMGDVSFCNVSSDSYGGAIYEYYGSTVEFTRNGAVLFNNNTTDAYGGAIYAAGAVSFSENEVVTFSGNSLVGEPEFACGGAISAFGDPQGVVDISRNGRVLFEENFVLSTGDASDGPICGGAILSSQDLLSLNENNSVVFNANSVSGDGAWGGAIALNGYCALQVLNNGEVAFTNNRNAEAQQVTAAVGGLGDSVRIQGNDHVLFRGNGFGIALTGSGTSLSLSAGRGQSIEMYDMMYVDSGNVSFNSSYTDEAGNQQRGEGDILISGRYLDEDYDWDVGTLIIYHSTSVQVEKRTTHVEGLSTLYAGRLRIEDGAVYEGGGFAVADAAAATLALHNASMVMLDGTDVTLSGGSTLELQGVNTITANTLDMQSGSAITFTVGEGNLATPLLTLTGTFLQEGTLTLDLESDGTAVAGNTYALLQTDGGLTPASWNPDQIIVGGMLDDVSSLKWENGILYGTLSLKPELITAIWSGAQSMAWNTGDVNWTQGEYSYRYKDGVDVVFDNTGAAGEVELQGELSPASVLVDNDTEHAYTFSGSGKLTGDMLLTKDGEGTLTVNTENDYTGGTVLSGGTLVMGNGNALGTGPVIMNGGTLDLGGGTIGAEDIVFTPGAEIGLRNGLLNGEFAVTGGSLTADGVHFTATSLSVEDAGDVTFRNARADSQGGAVCAHDGTVEFTGNENVTFADNCVSGASVVKSGGALSSDRGITMTRNETITFSGNSVVGNQDDIIGGAVCALWNSEGVDVDISRNGTVRFAENYVLSTNDACDGPTGGGAIYSAKGHLSLNENDSLVFDGNSVSGDCAWGGAIALGDTVDLQILNNGEVAFTNNRNADADAQHVTAAVSGMVYDAIRIQGNDHVLFRGNGFGIALFGWGEPLALSAGRGQSIEMYDMMYVDNGNVSFNGSYTDEEGNQQRGEGDILISGRYLDEDYDWDVGTLIIYHSTSVQVEKRTTHVEGLSTLYAGRLRIEDGAVYEGGGFAVADAAAATLALRDASMVMLDGTDVAISGGSTLELQGANSINAATLDMQSGSTLAFTLDPAHADTAILTLDGAFNQGGALTISLAADGALQDGDEYLLLSLTSQTTPASWNPANVTVTGMDGVSTDALSWDSGNLYFSYGETLPLTWNGWHGNIWNTSDANWTRNGRSAAYRNGREVVFDNTGVYGEVELQGELSPAGVLVDNALAHDYTFTGSGKLTGDMQLTKDGQGILTIGTENDYTGGTILNAGTLVAGSATAFGTGSIQINGGTLDLGGYTISNTVTAENADVVLHNGSLSGDFTVTGGSLDADGVGFTSGSSLSVANAENVSVLNASSTSSGGAIYAEGSVVSLTGNDAVTFSGNRSSIYSSYTDLSSYSYGGAIYTGSGSISFTENGTVTFNGNSTAEANDAYGGAIYASGSVSFTGNDAVTFSGNSASATSSLMPTGHTYGGAVYGGEGSTISLTGNGSVVFRGNYEKITPHIISPLITPHIISPVTYRLRSVYMDGGTLNLAAGEGQNITFYDTLYAAEGTSVSFNAAYEDKAGVMQIATGDIVFSGAHAEEDLRELNPSYTQSELTDSLTTEVYSTTDLYGGRLRIEDGAIYKGNGINVAAGSNATLRLADGTLDQAGYDVTLASGSTLELQGVNTITAATLDMQSGSTLAFTLDPAHADTAVLTLDGTFNQGGALNISLAADGTLQDGDEYLLLSLTSQTTPASWNPANVTVTGMDGVSTDALSWDSGNLYFSYGENLPLTWNGWHGNIWNTSDANWTRNGRSAAYRNGREVVFDNTGVYGEVELQGSLAPLSVLVDNDAEHGYAFTGSGKLTGDMQLTKEGAGTLSIATANDYTGGTILNAGTLVAGNASAFGTGTIQINGGALDLGGYTLANDITAENADVVLRNGSLSGDFSVAGGNLDAEALRIVALQDVVVQDAEDVSFRDLDMSLSVGSVQGGAIYGGPSSVITFKDNGAVSFRENNAAADDNHSYGGAIYGDTITLSDNDSVEFINNSASSSNYSYHSYGGAIYGGCYSTITLSGNESVTFSGNTTTSGYSDGGAIYGDDNSTITLSGNESVTFGGNTTSSYYSNGGAIYGGRYSTITLSDNGNVEFGNNSTSSSAESYGGAICGRRYSTITLSGNGSVEFSNNSASAGGYSFGGAIYGDDDSTITLSGNDSVEFSNNTASSSGYSYGGAIYGGRYSTITLSGNGSVEFSNNSVSVAAANPVPYGGAIYVYDGTVDFSGNGSVTFSGNYEKTGSGNSATYRLRSVYMNGGTLNMAAGEGQNITFYDTLYASADTVVSFNARYEDKDGVMQDATGDIVFSGAHAEEDLRELNPSYTQSELTDSLTSEVYATTNLYGGRLRIEDGAIYKGNGISVAAGSNATLRLANGTLNQAGYNVTLASGSTLDLQGVNTITANTLDMQSGSTLAFTLDPVHADTAILTLDGTFNQGGALNISLAADGTLQEGDEILLMSLSGTTTPGSWNKNLVTVTGLDACVDNLSWSNGGLYFTYYDPALLNKYRWTGANSMTWNTSAVNWTLKGQSVAYRNGVEVLFGNTRSGTVTLSSTLTPPQSVLVDNDAEHGYTFSGNGYLSGAMQLTKDGEGSLTLNTFNTYTGGTILNDGTLVAGNSKAFGTGTIQINGGTLNLGGYALSNKVTAENADVVLRNGSLSGDINIAGGSLDADGVRFISTALTVANAGDVSFLNASFSSSGGAIYANYNSTVSFTENGTLTFSGNSTTSNGGAIESYGSVSFADNDAVTFSGNSSSYGGAIDASSSTVSFTENEIVTFSENSAKYGGGIYTDDNVSFAGNEAVMFSENSASAGGAIYASSTVNFTDNGTLTFSGNSATSNGGAIHASSSSTVNFTDNGTLTFSGNSTTSYGGAIYAYSSTVSFADNDAVTFSGNSVTDSTFSPGGAIYASSSTVSFTENEIVTFSENSAKYGGGIYTDDNVSFAENGTVTFSGNSASTYGGAIRASSSSTVSFTGNEAVTFSENSATSNGGAIYASSSSTVSFADNDAVTFSGNSVTDSTFSPGGAIYASSSTVSFTGNEAVTFSGNSATDAGGAIYANSGTVSFTGNDAVTFRGNYEKTGSEDSATYRLRSVYMYGGTLKLAAGEGQNITFYDTLYADSSATLSLNAQYEDKDGVQHDATGDIVFSGKYAEADLRKLKPGYTQQELTDSLTTQVYSTTNLYGGRLSIEDGAVYKGRDVTVAADSNAALRLAGGTLNVSGYNVTLNGGTALELQGMNNSITAKSLTMAGGSTLRFTLEESNLEHVSLTMSGTFTQGGILNVDLQAGDSYEADERIMLMSMASGQTPDSWDMSQVTLSGLGAEAGHLMWESGVLYFNAFPDLVTATWTGSESRTWNNWDKNWTQGGYNYRNADGVDVVFGDTGSGAVELAGDLAPKNVLVDNTAGHDYTFTGSGRLTGDMQLAKDGGGRLTISTANTYTGDTVLNGGTLVAGDTAAFGGGCIRLNGGTLDLGGHEIANAVSIADASTGIRDGVLGGAVAIDGANVQVEGDLTVTGQVTVGGTVESSLTVADGAVLHIGRAIINNAYIELAGDIDITGLDGTVTGSSYTGGLVEGNGFLCERVEAELIHNGYGADFGWSGANITYDGATAEKDDFGGVSFTRVSPERFYVFKGTESVSTARSRESAEHPLQGIVLAADTTLYADEDVNLSLIQANGPAAITLKEGTTLTGYATGQSLTLDGAGVYALESRTSLGSVTLADTWSGTVLLTGTASGANFNSMARSGSQLELNGVSGYPITYNGTTTANIILTDTADGTAAFTATYGSSSNYGYTMKFSGAIRGEGTFVANAGTTRYENYELAGDISGWRGEFRYASGRDTVLTISGNAHEVNAAINGGSGLTLQVKTNAEFNRDVTAGNLAVNNAQAAFNQEVTAGNLAVNNAQAAFNQEVTAGSLALNNGSATFNDSLQVDGGISASGTSTLAIGTGQTLSLGSAISNSGSLTLSGCIDANSLSVSVVGTGYAGGLTQGNGFATTDYGVQVVSNTASASLSWQDADVLYNGREGTKRADGKYVYSEISDAVFHVNTGSESVSRALYAAESLGVDIQGISVANGRQLVVDRDVSTGFIGAASGSVSLRVDAGATLQSDGTAHPEFILGGSGAYRLAEGSTILDATLDDSGWMGTVVMHDASADFVDLNSYGTESSTVCLENVSGSFVQTGTTFMPTLELAGDGFEITSCNKKQAYEFAGGVKGSGNLTYNLAVFAHEQTYIFSGNVADWTGAYVSEANKTSTLKFYGNAAEMGADIRQTAGTVNVEVGNGSAEHTTAFKGEVEASSFTVRENATAVLENKAAVTGSVTVDGTLEVAEGGSLALAEAAAMSVGNAYTVTGQGGNAPALSGNIKADAFGFHGAEDHTARIDNAVVDLQAEASVVFDNVILGATSRLTDDPATVVANNMVIEGQYGVNVEEGAPMTIKSGSIMQRLGQPSELIELDSDATACRLDITNVENVSITGNCLTIDLSGMYPALQDYSRKFDWLGISLGSGDQVAALDTNMVVELKLNDRLHPRAYYLSGVGWGGTDFVMPVANGENVGMIYVCMFDVPEPATSTLSLLALAALAARRRRKH